MNTIEAKSRPMPEAPTRQRILDAALVAFAAQGPLGARVDDIAAAAQINKRMLYHYFGDKAGLFQAVLDERVLTRLKPSQGQTESEWLSSIGVDCWRMLSWHAQSPLLGRVTRRLGERQGADEMRRDVPAEVLALCLLGAYALPALLGVEEPMARPERLEQELQKLFAPIRPPAVRPRIRIQPNVRPRE